MAKPIQYIELVARPFADANGLWLAGIVDAVTSYSVGARFGSSDDRGTGPTGRIDIGVIVQSVGVLLL